MTQKSFGSYTDELITQNVEKGSDYEGADLQAAPIRQLAVVTCMDARMDIFQILSLKRGEAHILRNAGGVITDDVIRSLCLSQLYLDTREILLIHHTDCGLQKVNEEEFRKDVTKTFGVEPDWEVQAFEDPFEDVRQSMIRLSKTPFLRHKSHIRGFVYNVKDGLMHEVTAGTSSK